MEGTLADLHGIDSPKKNGRTNLFYFFAGKSNKQKNTNSFILFFGKIYSLPISLPFYLTFNKL